MRIELPMFSYHLRFMASTSRLRVVRANVVGCNGRLWASSSKSFVRFNSSPKPGGSSKKYGKFLPYERKNLTSALFWSLCLENPTVLSRYKDTIFRFSWGVFMVNFRYPIKEIELMVQINTSKKII